MMDKYKSWGERTATSPSDRHMGHFHALFKPFKFEDTADRVYIEEKQEPIINIHFIMLNITAMHSHTFERWHNILTCTIK